MRSRVWRGTDWSPISPSTLWCEVFAVGTQRVEDVTSGASRGSQPHEVGHEEPVREGSRAAQRAADRGRVLRRDGGQPGRTTCLPLADVEAHQRCGRGQGHVRVGVRVGEHALHSGRDGRHPQLAGRDGDLEPQVPACRLGVGEQRQHVVRDVSPRVDEGIERGMYVVRIGAGEELVDGGVRRRVVDAERDRVPRSPDEHAAEADAVLTEREPGRAQPQGREQQRDDDDRGDVEPDARRSAISRTPTKPSASGTPAPSTMVWARTRSSGWSAWYVALIEVRVVASVSEMSVTACAHTRPKNSSEAGPTA